jgi:hypothetical protein
MMDVAFSNPLGFCKEGIDVNNTIAGLQAMFDAAQLMVNLPGLVKVIQLPFLKNLLGPSIDDKAGPGFLQGVSLQHMKS